MLNVEQFVVGETYSNDQIRFTLEVSNLGGIRPSLGQTGALRHIVLITTESGRQSQQDNPYYDRIENDVLVFTGSGRKGHQELTGSNKRLLEQTSVPVPIFGFQNQGNQLYRFLGLLELLRHYKEPQIDSTNQMRDVWIFEFRIHSSPTVVPVQLAQRITAELLEESRTVMEQDEEIATVEPADLGSKKFSAEECEKTRATLLALQPYSFEHLIKRVLEHSGFTHVEVTRASGDGGIDLEAKVSDAHYFFAGTFVQVQAKRWRHAVGSVEINNFRGAMSSSAKGIFIATSYYTKAAVENASNPRKLGVTLIEGTLLARIILERRITL